MAIEDIEHEPPHPQRRVVKGLLIYREIAHGGHNVEFQCRVGVGHELKGRTIDLFGTAAFGKELARADTTLEPVLLGIKMHMPLSPPEAADPQHLLAQNQERRGRTVTDFGHVGPTNPELDPVLDCDALKVGRAPVRLDRGSAPSAHDLVKQPVVRCKGQHFPGKPAQE